MKLNKKGFTLVELLAVIIILAIVIGITIPAVLKTINSSRKSGGQDAAEIVANWIDDQYTLANVDVSSVDAAFTTLCGDTSGTTCRSSSGKTTASSETAAYNAIGLKASDVTSVMIKINTAGKSCVTLNINNKGSYYITENGGTQKYVAGRGCTETGYYVNNVKK